MSRREQMRTDDSTATTLSEGVNRAVEVGRIFDAAEESNISIDQAIIAHRKNQLFNMEITFTKPNFRVIIFLQRTGANVQDLSSSSNESCHFQKSFGRISSSTTSSRER